MAQIGPIERVSLTSAFDSTDWTQVDVECPPGTIAFSGGASLAFGTNPDLPIVIHQSFPVGVGDLPGGQSTVTSFSSALSKASRATRAPGPCPDRGVRGVPVAQQVVLEGRDLGHFGSDHE